MWSFIHLISAPSLRVERCFSARDHGTKRRLLHSHDKLDTMWTLKKNKKKKTPQTSRLDLNMIHYGRDLPCIVITTGSCTDWTPGYVTAPRTRYTIKKTFTAQWCL